MKWKKSSRSMGNGNCVEVAAWINRDGEPRVGMRDSKDPNGPVLLFTRAEWDAFVGGAKRGEFDNPLDGDLDEG